MRKGDVVVAIADGFEVQFDGSAGGQYLTKGKEYAVIGGREYRKQHNYEHEGVADYFWIKDDDGDVIAFSFNDGPMLIKPQYERGIPCDTLLKVVHE